jgi:hypothetical protein
MKKTLSIIFLSLILSACGGGAGVSPTADVTSYVDGIIACQVQPVTTQTPSSYNGAYPIPVAVDTLPNNIIRSIGVKDYYPTAGKNPLCVNDYLYSQNLFKATLDKLRNDNVDAVWIYNYGTWSDITQAVWTINKTTYQIPESQLTFFVSEAKKRNIKVYLVWQFCPCDVNGRVLTSSVTETQMKQILDTWHSHAVELAKYAESIGIAGLSADWNAYNPSNYLDYRELWVTSLASTIDDIRKNFTGKITFGSSVIPVIDSRILSKVDAIHLPLAGLPMLSANENNNLSVSLLRDKFAQTIFYYSLIFSEFPNLPVVFDIMSQSKYDFFVTGWSEDGFCINNCIQRTYATDFSVQAIGVEAALQAIKQQTYFNTFAVSFPTGYWHTDDMVPTNESTTGFPNLSQSLRNKPAEKIVRQWFKKV